MRNLTTASMAYSPLKSRFAIASAIVCVMIVALPAVARAAEPPQAGAAPAAGTATAVPSSSASAAQPSATAPAAPSTDSSAAKPVAAAETPKVICRDEKVTGSKLRTRKVCTSADSASNSGDWVRQQQARGAIGAGAILNGQ